MLYTIVRSLFGLHKYNGIQRWKTSNTDLEIGSRREWLIWDIVQYMSLNIIREIKFESTRCPARSGYELCAWGRSFEKQLTVVVGGSEVDAVGCD